MFHTFFNSEAFQRLTSQKFQVVLQLDVIGVASEAKLTVGTNITKISQATEG